MFKIEKGIKLPPVGGGLGIREEIRETLPVMEVGDSFLIKGAKNPSFVRAATGDIIKKSGAVLAMRKVKDGTRVWKVGAQPTRRRNGNGSHAR